MCYRARCLFERESMLAYRLYGGVRRCSQTLSRDKINLMTSSRSSSGLTNEGMSELSINRKNISALHEIYEHVLLRSSEASN